MIDLHIHTVFSDGKIENIKRIVDNCEIISITDHNTIQACRFFNHELQNSKLIIGCEVTVDRAPDYLVYFPGAVYSDTIENEFEKIRIAEEEVIKACYFNLGYTQWEFDIKRAYSKNQKLKNARTRDLAAIIHLYKTGLSYDNGTFDFDDLIIARRQRRAYAEKIGNPISIDIAFDIAKKFNGAVVIAHPLHTAIKRCSRENTNFTNIKANLLKLLANYRSKGGTIIEWEYFSKQSHEKYCLSLSEVKEFRDIILKIAKEGDCKFTIGTDSHSLDNYLDAVKWLENSELIIKDMLPVWALKERK